MRLKTRMDIKAILARIEERLAKLSISAERASLNSGLSRDAIRNLRRAERAGTIRGGANAETIIGLALGLETNVLWLVEGKGPEERLDQLLSQTAELTEIMGRLEEEDREHLLALGRRLSGESRRGAARGEAAGDDPQD